MKPTAGCPSTADLNQFWQGRVSDEEAERIERHLAECSRCSERLPAFQADDSLLARMRRRGSKGPSLEKEAVDNLIRKVKGFVESDGAGALAIAGHRHGHLEEGARQRFEEAWSSGHPEPIEHFLPEPSAAQYLPTLLNLALLEMELAWKRLSQTGTLADSHPVDPPCVEDYLRRFPVLNEPARVHELALQEYRMRNRYGQPPGREEFQRRFPGLLLNESGISTVTGGAPGTLPFSLPDIPGYELLEILGRGGMGVVYKARQKSLNRLVALKMVLAGAQADQNDLSRFRQEAEAVAQLHHPNIVQIHEIGMKDGQPFFSLEFVEGGSLAQRLGGKPQASREAAALVATLARAMNHVHQRHLVHRDLKPANVLLHDPTCGEESLPVPQPKRLDAFIPKISDFGLAKRLEGAAGHTHTGAVLGTPSYMAPEQAAGRTKDIGPPADIYALGAILYEMITGRPPFRANTPYETVLQVVKEDPPRPRQLQPGIERDLETICLKALAKEPAQRYPSALALANDLERYLAGEPIQARPEKLAARLWRKVKRRPVVYFGSLAGLVILAVAGAFLLLSRESEERAQVARQITELQTNLAKELDQGEFDKGHLERTDRLISQLSALAADRGEAARARIVEKHKAFLESQLKQARLTPEIRDRLDSSLKLFAKRDPEAAKVLAVAFKQRLHDWEGVFDVRAPFADLAKVFPGPLLKVQDNIILVNQADPKKEQKRETVRLLSKVPCQGNVRMEAVFDNIGSNVSEVGLLLNVGQTHARWVHALEFSPDGRWLASAGDDGIILVWDVASGQVKWQFQEPVGVVLLAFHPGGAILASAAGKTIRLWNLETGKATANWEANPHLVRCLTYSPDGKILASGGEDKTVKLWNTADNSLKDTLTGLPEPVGLVHMQDNKTLTAVTTGVKRLVRTYDLAGRGHQEFTIPFKYGDNVAALSPDGRLVAGSTWASSINVYNVPSGKFKTWFSIPYVQMAFSPTGKYLAAGCCHHNNQPMPLEILDLEKDRRRAVISAHTKDIFRLAFSADGSVLASASGDGTIRLWNVPDFTLKRILGGQSYAFVLSAQEGGAKEQESGGATFKGRAGQTAYLRLLVEGQEQRKKEIHLPAGTLSLRLRATRENNVLTFEVNDLPPMVFEDMFSLASLTQGVFGFQTNGEVRITQLRGYRQSAPLERSPLEQGDLLVASGKYREALDFYQEQALAAGTGPVGREARSKAGLCLVHLERRKEANTLFEQVFAQGQKDRWGQFAACQLLLERLSQNRFDDAETESLLEVLQPQAQQVAGIVPLETVNRILGTYGISPFDYLFFKESHLRRLKRGVAAENLFGRTANTSLKVQIQLLHGYCLLDRDEEARAYARKLFEQCKEAVAGKADPPHVQGLAMAECCWALRRLDDPNKLLLELESLIAQHGKTDFARPLWLEKARTLAYLKRNAQAEEVLAEFLKFPVVANDRDYGTYAGANLLMGFLCLDKGRPDLAKKYWKDGTVRSWRGKMTWTGAITTFISDPLSLHNQLILSSLANDLSDRDVKEIMTRATSGAHSGSPLQMALKSFPIPASVLREQYQSPRGLDLARKIAVRDLAFGEYIRGTAHLTFYEYLKQLAMPTALTPGQDAVVWKSAQDFFNLYGQGKVNEFQLLQFGLAWKQGSTGAFGWAGFSAKLEPEIKANLAYILGQRMRRLNKAKEAEFFFQQAVQAAPRGAAVLQLAKAELPKTR